MRTVSFISLQVVASTVYCSEISHLVKWLALLCNFERVLKQQMFAYLLENNLITRQQFGFLSKCSTCTQLLDGVNDWTLTVRDRRSADVIYFDFAKAFDSVSRPKLVHKLEADGICGNLLIY